MIGVILPINILLVLAFKLAHEFALLLSLLFVGDFELSLFKLPREFASLLSVADFKLSLFKLPPELALLLSLLLFVASLLSVDDFKLALLFALLSSLFLLLWFALIGTIGVVPFLILIFGPFIFEFKSSFFVLLLLLLESTFILSVFDSLNVVV